MNMEIYRRRLLEKEKELLSSLKTVIREQPSLDGLDEADVSIYSQQKELTFFQANNNSQLLAEVREALKRIDEGTYGQCLADGEMISKARLDAIPWATYCVKHQSMLDDEALPLAA